MSSNKTETAVRVSELQLSDGQCNCNYVFFASCISYNINKLLKVTNLCIKAMRSAARPEPSQTTTGTGGSSVTYSNTALIVLVPPSITKQTRGIE